MRTCKVCGFSSNDIEEVAVYDSNGYTREWDESSANNPDAFAYELCQHCVETFDFESRP